MGEEQSGRGLKARRSCRTRALCVDQQHIGSQPPLETAADQSASSSGIILRSDSLMLSSSCGETADPGFQAYSVQSTCSGTACILHEPQAGSACSLSISDLEVRPDSVIAVRSRNGITLFCGEGTTSRASDRGCSMPPFRLAENAEPKSVPPKMHRQRQNLISESRPDLVSPTRVWFPGPEAAACPCRRRCSRVSGRRSIAAKRCFSRSQA